MIRGSKQWSIEKRDLRAHPEAPGKPYNPEKFAELYEILGAVSERFGGREDIKTLTRSIIEETTNIIEHNRTWGAAPLRVNSKFNETTGKVKITIIYWGSENYDPVVNKITNVIGSTDIYARYLRKVRSDGEFMRISLFAAVKK